ncbi:MAG TPA: hypothetical protein V6D11_30715 [Waterburya sp.]|jgi:hypothetical protein
MPRLVGQRSNNRANISVLIIFAAIVGILLEYLGAIDIVPGFGREGGYFQLQGQPTNEQGIRQTHQ